ncbi:response regulator transcription factor [Burkholderia territorii]|uniref:response regulator transcription factor n=1 Tax=Burkholderia territorii TaxID=1503055 RepID=UPI0009BF63C2|nr:response regulator transcription factor [Burkholderia territorii]
MEAFSIRVAVASDYPVVVEGLTQILRAAGMFEVVGECENLLELTDLLSRTDCDVLVFDYPFGQAGRILPRHDQIAWLRQRFPDLKMVLFAPEDDAAILRALKKRGESVLLTKRDPVGHFVTAVHACFARSEYLSPAAKELLAESVTSAA